MRSQQTWDRMVKSIRLGRWSETETAAKELLLTLGTDGMPPKIGIAEDVFGLEIQTAAAQVICGNVLTFSQKHLDRAAD